MNSSNPVITIRKYTEADKNNWDYYVMQHPQGTLYHLSGWKNVIEKTYGHNSLYLMAMQQPEPGNQQLVTRNSQAATRSTQPVTRNPIVGILPLVHLKHFLFGNTLVSMPFFDMGGILADNNEIEKDLLYEAVKLCQKLKVQSIELRHTNHLLCLALNSLPTETLQKFSSFRQSRIGYSQILLEAEKTKRSSQSCKSCQKNIQNWAFQTRSHKVRMLLDLPDSSEKLMKSFKSKLRSQIRKPIKEGLKPRIGGLELLDDFYDVFSTNMRDLGSPVHSKHFMKNVIEAFPDKAKIFIIYKENKPIACSLMVGFKHTLENPWASALRKYSSLSSNMLLYWSMIEYACDNGYLLFDFGRSSPDEGTYKFKKLWGAEPESLHWHYISLNGHVLGEETSEKSRFARTIQYWKRLPVSLTKIVGPYIRKYIGL